MIGKVIGSIIKALVRLFSSAIFYAVLFGLAAVGIFFWDGGLSEAGLRSDLIKANPGLEARLVNLDKDYRPEDMLHGYEYYRKHYGKSAMDLYAKDLVNENGESVLKLCRYIRLNGGQVTPQQAQMMETFLRTALPTGNKDEVYFTNDEKNFGSSMLQRYSSALERAREEGGRTADVVKQNYISVWMYDLLCLTEETKSRDLWEKYCDMSDWLPDALSIFWAYSLIEGDNGNEEKSAIANKGVVVKNFLRFIGMCADYLTFRKLEEEAVIKWRNAVQENKQPETDGEPSDAEVAAGMIVALYAEYEQFGKEIETICHASSMKPEECVNFVQSNLTAFNEAREKKEKQKIIDAVCRLYKRARDGGKWETMLETPDVLRVYMFAAEDSFFKVMQENSALDATQLILYAASEDGKLNRDAVCNAVKAVSLYGKPAIDAMLRYLDVPELPRIMAQDFRSLYFIEKEPDGFKHMCEKNWRGWLDKYYDVDGKRKDEPWIVHLPLGSVIQVTEDWVQGYPCTWGEMGWAAYDSLEAAATILAAVATVPAGGSGGVAVKGGMSAFKAAVKAGGKIVARKTGKGIVKVFEKKGGKEVLVRTVATKATKATARAARHVASLWKQVKGTGRDIRDIIGRHPRLASGVVAGSMIGFELCARTLPNADKITYGFLHDLWEKTAECAQAASRGSADGLADACGTLFENPWIRYGISIALGVLALFFLFSVILGNKRKKSLQYV